MSTVVYKTYPNFVNSRAKDMGTASFDFLHAAVGCATEAGELLDTAKKIWVYSQDFATTNKEVVTHAENIKEELGDMLFYIQLAANIFDVDIEDLMVQNMEKLTKRYPVGYSDKAAAERADKS